MANEREDALYGKWEDLLIEQALSDQILAEMDALQAAHSQPEWERIGQKLQRMRPEADGRVEKMLRRYDKHMLLRRRAMNLLRTAAVAAVTVCVGFSGICLASPNLREQLITLVESTWGTYTSLHVDQALFGRDGLPLVERDHPLLQYVHPDWCLHYYPLEVPRYFNNVQTSGIANASYNGDEALPYMTEEQRSLTLEYDFQSITFLVPNAPSRYYVFTEDGRPNNSMSYDTRYQDVCKETIDGTDVTVIAHGGLTTFVWQEDDHLLKLISTESMDDMIAVFKSVERIR